MAGAWWVRKKELVDEQLKILDLSADEDHLITGPPGSGKTNLLILRAEFLARNEKPNLAVVIFTRGLREFISTGAEEYAFEKSRIKTSVQFYIDLLKEYGVGVNLARRDEEDEDNANEFEETRATLIGQVQRLIKSKKLNRPFDCILLDEAQDYLPEEVKIFRELGTTLFVTADARQRIYAAETTLDEFRNVIPNRHKLEFHFRCGQAICRLADAIAKTDSDHGLLLPKCKYDEASRPSTVLRFTENNFEAQVDRAAEELATQLAAYPKEYLGVLCPRAEDAATAARRLGASPKLKGRVIYQRSRKPKALSLDRPIVVSTIHTAKGMEFTAVHLLNAERTKGMAATRNLVYTAVTRAKTSLRVYHSAALLGFFEGALQATLPKAPSKKGKTIDDLFRTPPKDG